MYGCIVGSDGETIWIICEGEYSILEKKFIYLKSVLKTTEIRLVQIGKDELETIKNDVSLVIKQFEKLF